MTKLNVIGVDLAKTVIQVSVVSPSNRELRNSALSRRKFAEFLGRQRPSLVAFEACATSHYWARVAQRHGHAVKVIPAKAVFPFRQGHKTDQNDALAVAEAAGRPNAKLAPLKTVEQQGMQAIQRSRELLVHERVSLSNHLRGLLMEFGIVIPQGFATLYRLLQQLLVTGIALSSERILAVTLGRLAPVTQAPGIDTQLFGYQNIGDAWFVSSS